MEGYGEKSEPVSFDITLEPIKDKLIISMKILVKTNYICTVYSRN